MLDTLRTFNALCEEFVECTLRDHPVEATRMGIHDYDHRLPTDTPDGFRERAAWLRDLEQRLVASVPWDELPLGQRVEYALLRSRIAGMRADFEEIRVQARNPALYPETALLGVHLLMQRLSAPLDERKEAVLERMMAIPEYLQAARANLEQVPELLVDVAAGMSGSGITFMEEVTHQLIRGFPAESERIEHAGSRARRGFAEYQDFLRGGLGTKVGGAPGVGERWMNYKLEREFLVPMDCVGLDAFGREQMARARTRLEAEAKRVDPSRPWQRQLEEARGEAAEPPNLIEAYGAEIERARRFVEERRLAPVPATRLEIVDTPEFLRLVVPRAAYQPPAPFDHEPVGRLYVTPADPGPPAEERQRQLRGHHPAAVTLTAVHEAWPGHHLQMGLALDAGSRLRAMMRNNVFSEGWATYAEVLMAEHGFFEAPAARLEQLRNQLWRACRVVLDAGLQTGRMTADAAVDLLVDEAMVERAEATAEVRGAVLMPGPPMSDLVGQEMLLELREEARRRMGARFELNAFHAALLAGGALPPTLVREEIWARLAP